MPIEFVNPNDPESVAAMENQKAQSKLNTLREQVINAKFGIARMEGPMPIPHLYGTYSNGSKGYAGADWSYLYDIDPVEAKRKLSDLEGQLAGAEVDALKARNTWRASWEAKKVR